MFHGSIPNRLALLQVLSAPGGEKLSPETAHFCAELLMTDPKESAIDLAKRLGTLNKADRSEQYRGRYSNEVLKHDIDLLFQKQREKDDRDFWHKVILALIALIPSILIFVLWYYG